MREAPRSAAAPARAAFASSPSSGARYLDRDAHRRTCAVDESVSVPHCRRESAAAESRELVARPGATRAGRTLRRAVCSPAARARQGEWPGTRSTVASLLCRSLPTPTMHGSRRACSAPQHDADRIGSRLPDWGRLSTPSRYPRAHAATQTGEEPAASALMFCDLLRGQVLAPAAHRTGRRDSPQAAASGAGSASSSPSRRRSATAVGSATLRSAAQDDRGVRAPRLRCGDVRAAMPRWRGPLASLDLEPAVPVGLDRERVHPCCSAGWRRRFRRVRRSATRVRAARRPTSRPSRTTCTALPRRIGRLIDSPARTSSVPGVLLDPDQPCDEADARTELDELVRTSCACSSTGGRTIRGTEPPAGRDPAQNRRTRAASRAVCLRKRRPGSAASR